MGKVGRPREPNSLASRAKKEGVSITVIRWRDNAEYRKRHTKLVKANYLKNREALLEKMRVYSVKHQGRVICPICRHKYKDLEGHLRRHAIKEQSWIQVTASADANKRHIDELRRIYGKEI